MQEKNLVCKVHEIYKVHKVLVLRIHFTSLSVSLEFQHKDTESQ